MSRLFLITVGVGVFVMMCTAGISEDDSNGLPYPFQDAKVGQWVKHRLGNGIVRGEIIDINERGDVSVEVEIWKDDTLIDSKVHIHTVDQIKADRALPNSGDVISIEHTIRTVLGREMPVSIVTQAFLDEETIKTVFSGEIPVYGEVLIEISGRPYPLSELIDYKK
ncbi:MAG: hypothetical protein LIP18_08090 [Planctomycetes bacterium]|nr:hypothetical protein [Planctomycetota bacterium]